MRATFLGLLAMFFAATVFALSNTGMVTVMFWQWPIYTGSLALALVGAGVLGALLVFFGSLGRHRQMAGRIRDLERQAGAQGSPGAPTAAAPPAAAPQYPGRIDDTRRLP